MKTKNVIRTVMGSLALAGICAAAPLDKPAKGVAQGRWLELTPRTTLLHGFLDERAGKHAYHMQAALIATTPSSGAVYGSLEPTQEPASNALRGPSTVASSVPAEQHGLPRHRLMMPSQG